MSDTVIKVENLSKQYRIGGAREGYKTFRETLVDAAKAPFQQLGRLFNRQSSIDNRHSETIWALKDVSFEVKSGEVVGIIGRNGAGKSTLLKILSKITEPTEGRVELRGRVGSLLEVGTGFHPELTGHENVYMYGAILGMDRWEVTRKFDEIVAFAEIEKFIETPVKRYSSGMYMRLAFAVAAHMETEILLVDEVLAVGDALFQKKCLGKMGEVSMQGRTVLFVSHNMQAVKRLCKQGILLHEGRIAGMGPAETVVDKYLVAGLQCEVNTDISSEMHRIYTGDIEVYRVEPVNQAGKLTDSLFIDETFFLRIFYRIHNPKLSYRVGIVFYTADEIRIATTVNTHDGREHIKGDKNRSYKLSVQIKNSLLPGSYSLEVNTKTVSNQYVDSVRGIQFLVLPVSVSADSPQGAGLIWLDVQWSDPEQVTN